MADNSTTAVPAPSTATSSSMGLLIGLPLIVVIFTTILVLLLVLTWLSLRSRMRTTRNYRYASLPVNDPTHFHKLPYKPTPAAIKLGDPPLPSMSFHMATQLDSPLSAARSPYPNPFAQHRSQSKVSIYGEMRPPRLRTRRKGNHKHGLGKHAIRQNAEPTPEVAKEEKKGKQKAERSPSIVSLGVASELGNGSLLVPGKWTSALESSRDKPPEIFITLLHNKDTASLVVRIERVIGLPFRDDGSEVDAYVRLYFIPKVPELPQRKTSKTRLARRDSAPVFEEEICYEAMSTEELINSTLHMQVLDYQSYGKHRLLGQADLHLVQVSFDDGEASVHLTLSPPTARENLGTVLLSLSYNPESKKLSVIILRAKDLNKSVAKDIDAQAKLYVAHGDKVMAKLKTRKKPQSCSPIFNEALTCTVEPEAIRSILVYVTMLNENSHAARREIGQVILGCQTRGEEYRHWNDILATPGKHIAEWHELR